MSLPDTAYGKSTEPKSDAEPRCEGKNCNRMLARFLTRPWIVDCPVCKFRNERK